MCGIVEKLLEQRGLFGDAREAFLDPSLKRLAPAEDLPGIRAAVDVILPFVSGKRPIVIFSDYDCDGVCGSAILTQTLRKLGASVSAFLPDRFTEGYGLTEPSLARLLKEHPDVALVITVDCGITSSAEVKALKERGISVVVTDHHLPPEELPSADVVVDPKIPAQREDAARLEAQDLCGAGVAFFLAGALIRRACEMGLYDGGKFAAPLLVLAGLATVVDIVPLLGQNRILAANALHMFRSAPVGLRELLLRCQKRAADELTSRDFGMLLGPRINAAGRMASAREAYDLLLSEDREAARQLAFRLNMLAAERKTVENNMIRDALAQISGHPSAAIVVSNRIGNQVLDWHPGVCGIVASRILDRYGVPVAVMVDGHGSARAPEGYDLHAVLTACADTLARFGGHRAAAGFTVKADRAAEFAAAFVQACAAQGGAENPRPAAELWVEPGDLTMELYEELKRLEPFGEGNPAPVFGLRGVLFSYFEKMGNDDVHAAFSFGDSRIPRATWWNHGELVETLRAKSASRFDITFTLDISTFGSVEPHLELRLRNVAPSVA